VDNAVLDMGTAYVDAAGRTLPDATELGAGNIGGMTLAPGLYKWSTGVIIPTSVTLSGGANDVWIFQIAGDLSIAAGGDVPSGKKVILTGGAQASNVFWQVGGATGATLGTYSTFNGTILSAKQVIIDTGAVLNGRALAQTQVTLDASVVSVPQPPPPPGTPTLGKAFLPSTILENDISTLTITLFNPNALAATINVPLIDTLPSGVVIATPTNASTTCTGSVVTTGVNTVTLTGGSIPANGSCTVTVNVTAANAGSYVNTLPAGALQTSEGNNASPAIATLNVSQPSPPPPPACSFTMNIPTSPTYIGTFTPGIYMSYDPIVARPFGLKEAGDILTGRLWLPCWRNGHADIYIVLDAPAYGGKFMFNAFHQWLSFPANIQPWQTYTDDDVYAELFSYQKSGILPGNYKLDVIVVPSGTAASTIGQIVSGATAAPYYKWSFTRTLP
jgi:hypothetical protein